MSRQESLVEERYRGPSSTMSPYAMRLMADSLSGVEVETTVDRFCRVFLAGIQGIDVKADVPSWSLSVCASRSTRAYLVTRRASLKDVLGEDWSIARLSGIEEQWRELSEQHSVCFVSVSVYQVPETRVEAGTAFRLPREKDGKRLHSAKADAPIMVIRTGGLSRLPRPEMQHPYVEDTWVALSALLAASRQGRTVELGRPIFSESFHLSVGDDLVSEYLPDARVAAIAVSPIDAEGLKELGREVRSTFSAALRRAKSEPRVGSVGYLVESVLGELIYPKEDTTKLRYLRLWQGLADATGGNGNNLGHDVAGLEAHDTKRLYEMRGRMGHPSRLPRDYSSERALLDLKKAALAWLRSLGRSSN